MIPQTPPRQERPLSVRIGRIVVRLVLLSLIGWGIVSGYHAYARHKRAQEIAPIHAYARDVFLSLRRGDYFAVQENLVAPKQHQVSIDWLAHFVENAELNATNRLSWGEWNKTESNTTRYALQGSVQYKTGRTQKIEMTIQKDDDNLSLLQLRLGKRPLLPTAAPSFP